MVRVAKIVLVLLAICWPRVSAAADLTLAWDPPADRSTTGYIIFYGTASHAYTQHVDVGYVTSYTVTALAPGTTYYFAVVAYDALGHQSAPSDEVYGTTDALPTATLTGPPDGSSYAASATVALTATASDPDVGDTIDHVTFYANGSPIGTSAAPIAGVFSYSWTNVAAGPYSLTAVSVDNHGASSPPSNTRNITVTGGGGGASAVFVTTDSTTQGNWQGVYGADGYSIVGDVTSLPVYAALTPSGTLQYTWAASTSDGRALARVGGGRVAATWYSGPSFDLDVNVTSGTHQVALYCLDWDTTSRSQRIDVLDAVTGAVLDTRTATGFNGGKYLSWNVTGHVKFRVTLLAGANAVVSAVFFGATGAGGPSAAFVTTDTTTQGNWGGVYGGDGYSLVSDATSLPAYATLTAIGAAQWTWAASTSDVRALSRAGGGRVAATWYSGSSFDLDVNVTSGTHQVALYCLDWDSTSRSQQIDVLDAGSSVLLDSQTVSDFNGGKYLVWNITGHVRFRVTRLGGVNAVVSAVFFGPATAPELAAYLSPKPEPGFVYSGRGGLKMSSTRAPSEPARIVCGTFAGVRQKSPLRTGISSPPCTRTADPSSNTPHCSSG